MITLIAQTSASGQWYDGWQLLLLAFGTFAALGFTVVIAVVGWLYRQMKADISELKNDMNRRFDNTDGRVDELYKMLAMKGQEVPPSETQPPVTHTSQHSVTEPAMSSPATEPTIPTTEKQTAISPALATAYQSQATGFASAQSENQ